MLVLMKCVAEAVVAKGARGLLAIVPGGAFLFDVAADAVRRLRERQRAAELRQEVLSAATATLEEVKQAAAVVVKEVAPDAPVEDQIALEMYLTQIPGAVRQSLKRPEDPSGKTVPPDLAINEPVDLLKRLPQRAVKFRPDDTLPGKPGWKLVELLGTGGFGEVWLARNPSLSALKGAVKFGLDPQARDRLLRYEGSLVNRVMEQGKHPNVVQLLDAHLEGDAPWLMYEYVPGGDLTGLILAWQQLPPDERAKRTTAALQTLASAVGHFHRLSPPLVHRDLKPSNILLQRTEGRGQKTEDGKAAASSSVLCPLSSDFSPKIADFGIGAVAAAASLQQEATRGATGVMVSQLYGSYTPLYASPQQQRGEPPDPRDDVHALGVIGYQMLTGKFDATLGADYAKTLRRLAVPEPLIELLGDCAAHDPANRPRDAAELAERLAALAAPPPKVDDGKIEVTCPICGARAKIPATAVGRRIQCPVGNHVFQVPVATPPTPSAPSPSAPSKPRPIARPVEALPEPRREREPEPEPESELWRLSPPKGVPRRWLGWLLLACVGPMILCGGGLFTWLGTRSGGGGMPATQTPTLPDDPKPMQKQAGFERHIKTEGKATAVQISPDGRYVAAAVEPVGRPKRLMGYRLLDESQTVTTLDEELIFAFDFSPDGQRLVAEVRDKSISRSDIRELSAENGTWMYLLKKPGESPAWLGYTPDGRYVLGVAEKLYRWPVDSPAANPTTVNDKEGNPLAVTYKTRVVFDPSKRYAAVVRGSVGKTVLYRLPDLTFHTELGEGGDEHCVFTTKGDRVVTWNGSRAVVWNTQTGTSEVEHITTCGEPVQLLLTADDRRLVTVGKIDTQVWELLDKGQPGLTIGTPRVTPGRPSGLTEIARAALNPSGRALATVSPSGKIRVRDMTSVNRPGNELTGHRGRIQDIRFTPDGKKLVAAGDEGIFVWSTSDPDRW